MRFSSLAWLAVAPLLIACGADSDAAGDDGTSAPEINRKPANGDPSNPSAPSTPGGSQPGASGGSTCIAQPACNGAKSPALGPIRPFTHGVISNLVVAAGAAHHRGRDQILSVGDPQWVIGKITYSAVDKDLKDEDVDIFVERGCGGTWEKLGTVKT